MRLHRLRFGLQLVVVKQKGRGRLACLQAKRGAVSEGLAVELGKGRLDLQRRRRRRALRRLRRLLDHAVEHNRGRGEETHCALAVVVLDRGDGENLVGDVAKGGGLRERRDRRRLEGRRGVGARVERHGRVVGAAAAILDLKGGDAAPAEAHLLVDCVRDRDRGGRGAGGQGVRGATHRQRRLARLPGLSPGLPRQREGKAAVAVVGEGEVARGEAEIEGERDRGQIDGEHNNAARQRGAQNDAVIYEPATTGTRQQRGNTYLLTPPAKSFVSVLDKSLIQVRRCHDSLTRPAAAGCCTSTGPEAASRILPVARIRRYK